MAIILLAYGPYVVIVNLLGYICTLGRAPRTKETLPDFREWCWVTPTFMSIPRVDGLSTDPRVLGRHNGLYKEWKKFVKERVIKIK